MTNLLLLLMLLSSAFTVMDKSTLGTDAKSMELLKALETVNGGWSTLLEVKDVEFTYEYHDLGKKAKDISIERYIFDGETSWAKYSEHNVNVLPGKAGMAKQCYMDDKATMTLEGEAIKDPKLLGAAQFLRKANFYWFTMMYKLRDPGTHHKYMGTEEFNGITYDKVSLTYSDTGKPADDEYILYFNPKTHLVDLFYFSLPAMGVTKPILRMELEYEKIDGVYVGTKRKGVFPNEKGEYNLGGEYTSTNVKFNNGFKKEDLSL